LATLLFAIRQTTSERRLNYVSIFVVGIRANNDFFSNLAAMNRLMAQMADKRNICYSNCTQ
jgi:hypothetical protein